MHKVGCSTLTVWSSIYMQSTAHTRVQAADGETAAQPSLYKGHTHIKCVDYQRHLYSSSTQAGKTACIDQPRQRAWAQDREAGFRVTWGHPKPCTRLVPRRVSCGWASCRDHSMPINCFTGVITPVCLLPQSSTIPRGSFAQPSAHAAQAARHGSSHDTGTHQRRYLCFAAQLQPLYSSTCGILFRVHDTTCFVRLPVLRNKLHHTFTNTALGRVALTLAQHPHQYNNHTCDSLRCVHLHNLRGAAAICACRYVPVGGCAMPCCCCCYGCRA